MTPYAEAPEEPEDRTTPRAKERFVSVVEYYHEYDRHEGQGCGLVDLMDTLSIRPAFLCRTCEVIVRANHDECIDLARVLGTRTPRER